MIELEFVAESIYLGSYRAGTRPPVLWKEFNAVQREPWFRMAQAAIDAIVPDAAHLAEAIKRLSDSGDWPSGRYYETVAQLLVDKVLR